MDLNYEVSTWDTPKNASIIKITHDILEAARVSPSRTHHLKIIESRAIERVQKLKLSPEMEYESIKLIYPIMLNMMCWYTNNVIATHGDSIRPVMTHYGTLDEAKSVRAFVSSDAPIRWRFQMACDYCLEDDIFKIGKQLSSAETRMYFPRNFGYGPWFFKDANNSQALPVFWTRIYKGRFDVQKGLKDLSQLNCARGYFLARNTTAKMYFLEKASEEIMQRYIAKYNPFRNVYLDSPPWIAKLFTFIDENQLKSSRGAFCRTILIALLQWPYQHLFRQAAEMLVDGLDESDYFRIVEAVMKVMKNGYKDHNYMDLFIGFWKMGTDQKSKLLLNHLHLLPLIRSVFLLENETLTLFIFDEIPALQKEAFLFNFDCDCLCMQLLRHEQFKAFEILLRVCRLKDTTLFMKAQRFLENLPPYLLPEEILNPC